MTSRYTAADRWVAVDDNPSSAETPGRAGGTSTNEKVETSWAFPSS
jgi:hypothetical protein